MTRTKAADVASGLTNLGYAVTVTPGPDANSGWLVRVNVEDGVPAATVATYATSQSITASVRSVEFS